MKKILEIKKQYSKRFNVADIEILLSEIIGQNTAFVTAHPEYELNLIERIEFSGAIRLLKKGWPLAYITGHKEFFGLDFFVNKYTLIPRPETELMVENAVEILQAGGNTAILVDIGTGTGCVPIAVLKTLKQKNIRAAAIDISRGALKVAKANAKRHGVKIKFWHGDLLTPVIPFLKLSEAREHKPTLIITANLPYLTAEQFKNEPSIRQEPYGALVTGKNGLALYEKLLKQISKNSKALRQYDMAIFFEIDPRQTANIKNMIKNYFINANIEIKKDLARRDRLVKITSIQF